MWGRSAEHWQQRVMALEVERGALLNHIAEIQTAYWETLQEVHVLRAALKKKDRLVGFQPVTSEGSAILERGEPIEPMDMEELD